jgi:hypothetical protein
MQKTLRIEYRTRIPGKNICDGFAGYLGGPGPFSMATHTVSDNQKRGVLALDQNDPILILLTASDKA